MLIRPVALKDKLGNGNCRVFQADGIFARPIAKEDVDLFLFDVLRNDQGDDQNGFQLAREK